jgi:hypothetical protein
MSISGTSETGKVILSSLTGNIGMPDMKEDGNITFDVILNAAISYDILNSVDSFAWDLNGDGVVDVQSGCLSRVTARFEHPGIYLPSVTITDADGNTYTDTSIVNVTSDIGMVLRNIWLNMSAERTEFSRCWNKIKI